MLTANLTVAPPWGDYDSDQLVNLGNNRWAFKPEVGVYQPVGRFTLEAYAGAWLFAANHDYFPGTAVKRQDPLVGLRSHVAYAATQRVWLSLDPTWFSGGRTSVNGVENAPAHREAVVEARLSHRSKHPARLRLRHLHPDLASRAPGRRASPIRELTIGLESRGHAPDPIMCQVVSRHKP